MIFSSEAFCLPLQITFPQDLSGVPGSAKAQLREVIRSCLHSRPEDRPTAMQVQAELYDIINQQQWSTGIHGRDAVVC